MTVFVVVEGESVWRYSVREPRNASLVTRLSPHMLDCCPGRWCSVNESGQCPGNEVRWCSVNESGQCPGN